MEKLDSSYINDENAVNSTDVSQCQRSNLFVWLSFILHLLISGHLLRKMIEKIINIADSPQ